VDSSGGTGGNAENPLYTMVYKASDLAKIGTTTNYYIANDIDLTELGKWDGPDNYKGHFNGGGNTIKLQLSKGTGATGLFDSLASGAIIENLNVDVSTVSGGVDVSGYIYFGAVVGSMPNNTTCKLKNISVKGELNYRSFNSSTTWVLIGGIFGEIDQGYSGINVTLENCESDLIITAEGISISSSTMSHVSIGSLVGKVGNSGGTVKIINCRTGGSITASMSNDKYLLDAGGIIGCASKDSSSESKFNNGAQVNLTIENCYSTTEINIERTANTNASSAQNERSVIAGGLIGVLSNRNAVIKNNVAVNPSVVAGSTDKNAYSYPVIGYIFKSGSVAPFKTLDENYAVSDMPLGVSKDFNGNTPVAADPNTLANLNGAAASPAELSSQSFWTARGFSTDNWDFTGLSVKSPGTPGSVYPKLKKTAAN
jgi:hypothetical protein